MNFIIYDISTGEIKRQVICGEDQLQGQIGSGEAYLQSELDWQQQYVAKGVLISYTQSQLETKKLRPEHACYWSNNTFSWVDERDLSQVKSDQWLVIKRARNSVVTSALSTPYGNFDADVYSQKNITDAIALLQTLAGTGAPQTIDYTMADNSVTTLTTAQMVEVGILLGTRTQQAYATGRALRAQIEAATTVAEVEAVTWPD